MRIFRVALALLLVPVLLFSAFGFLAGFEPPGFPAAQALYAVTSAGSLAYIVRAVAATLRGRP